MAVRLADRPSTGHGTGWNDLNDGWTEVGFPRTRPTLVATDRGAVSPIAWPDEVALERPASLLRISDVLARWRAAERALSEAAEGTSDWARIQAGLIEFRALHRAMFEERLRSCAGEASEFGASLPADVLRRAWR